MRARPAAVALLAAGTAAPRAASVTAGVLPAPFTSSARTARARAPDTALASAAAREKPSIRTCAAPAEIADRRAAIRALAPGARRVPAPNRTTSMRCSALVCVVVRVRIATVAWPRWPPASVTVTVSTSRLAWSGAA